MSPEDVAAVARGLPGTAEFELFRAGLGVHKVAGRVFVIISPPGEPPRVTLKCDPELALALRAQYAAVTPGYHVNHRLWNTVELDGTVPDDEIAELVRHSWEQSVANLRKAERERLTAELDRPADI